MPWSCVAILLCSKCEPVRAVVKVAFCLRLDKYLLAEIGHFFIGILVVEIDQVGERAVRSAASSEIFVQVLFEFVKQYVVFRVAKIFSFGNSTSTSVAPPSLKTCKCGSISLSTLSFRPQYWRATPILIPLRPSFCRNCV